MCLSLSTSRRLTTLSTQETIFPKPEEFQIDLKTIIIIRNTLTNMSTRLKLRGIFSEKEMTCFLFNCVLEKVFLETQRNHRKRELINNIRLGSKKKGTPGECLAYENDMIVV